MRADGSISLRFRCPCRHVTLPQRVYSEVLRASTRNNTETATMAAVQTVEQQLAAGGHCLAIRRTVEALTPRPWPSVVLQPHTQTGEWEVRVTTHFQETVALQWDRTTQDVVCEIENALTTRSTPSTSTHVLRIKATWRCHRLSFSGAVVVEAVLVGLRRYCTTESAFRIRLAEFWLTRSCFVPMKSFYYTQKSGSSY